MSKNLRCLALLSALFLPLTSLWAADLLQNVFGRNTISLDGPWEIIIDPYDAGIYDYRMNEVPDGYFKNRQPTSPGDHSEYDFSPSDCLYVPGDWNTQRPELLFYEGSIWYKKDFKCNMKDNRLLYLYFGAANYEADVYLNGEKLGRHTGGFTPFNFDITKKVKKGLNQIIVRVNNNRHADGVPTANCDWWNYGGLTRNVMLVETGIVHVDDYEVLLADNDYKNINIGVTLNLPVAGVKVRVKIPELGVNEKLTTNNEGRAATTVKKTPELWSPKNPKLYRVEIKCEGDEMVDEIGFRHIETRGRQILLNGQPIFLRGVSMHEEAPFRTGRACTEEDDSVLISWAKFLGCNMIRLAHYPHNEQMVRMAERKGLIVWSEIPVYWTIHFENPETYRLASQQLRENMDRDHNRCAICIWSIANETPRGQARDQFLAGLAKQVKQRDHERLLSMAMEISSEDGRTAHVRDNMSQWVDIISFNNYLGWYGGKASDCDRRQWDIPYQKPFFVSEFGAGGVAGRFGSKDEKWTEEYQAEVYRKTLQMYNRTPGFAGCSPWVLMDFRSPRRQNHVAQNFFNRKGLISERGQTKQAFYVLQDFYKQKGAFK